MRSDSDIKRDVEDELRWDPDIHSDDIAVAVKSGVVESTATSAPRSRVSWRLSSLDAVAITRPAPHRFAS